MKTITRLYKCSLITLLMLTANLAQATNNQPISLPAVGQPLLPTLTVELVSQDDPTRCPAYPFC